MRLLLFYFILQHAAISLAQNLTINTPPSVLTCANTLITWTGGTQPYTLQLLADGGNTAGTTLGANLASTSFTWSVDESAGSSWAIQVKDASGNTAETAIFTIQASTSICVPSTQTATSRTTSTSSNRSQTRTRTSTRSSTLSTESTTTHTRSASPSATHTPSASVNVKAVAIGITMALIVSIIAVALIFIFCRIRRKRRVALEESESLRPQHPTNGSNNPTSSLSMVTVPSSSGFDYYSRTPVPFHIPSTSSLAPTAPNSAVPGPNTPKAAIFYPTTPNSAILNSTAPNSVAANPIITNPIVANSNLYNAAVSHIPLSQHPTASVPPLSYLPPPPLPAPTPGPPAYKMVASPSEPVPQALPFSVERYPSDRKE